MRQVRCPNKIKEFGYRYEEENAIVVHPFEIQPDKIESIIKEICDNCERGQHHGYPKSQ